MIYSALGIADLVNARSQVRIKPRGPRGSCKAWIVPVATVLWLTSRGKVSHVEIVGRWVTGGTCTLKYSPNQTFNVIGG